MSNSHYNSPPHFEDPLIAPRPHKVIPDLPANVCSIEHSISHLTSNTNPQQTDGTEPRQLRLSPWLSAPVPTCRRARLRETPNIQQPKVFSPSTRLGLVSLVPPDASVSLQFKPTLSSAPVSYPPFSPTSTTHPQSIAHKCIPHRTVTHNPIAGRCHPIDARSVIRSHQKSCLV